jgi:hypothetical protein
VISAICPSDWFDVVIADLVRLALLPGSSNCRSSRALLMAWCGRVPVLAQQMLGLVADDEVTVAGNSELDMHDWGDRSGAVFGALVDPDPAGDQAVVELFEIGNPGADLLLRPVGACDIMEGDFERHLQHRQLHTFGAFRSIVNAG